jgi:hypothetical protein
LRAVAAPRRLDVRTVLPWILIGLFPLVVTAALVKRRRIPPPLLLGGAAALGLLAALVARPQPLDDLTPAALEAARRRWSERGPRSYDLDLVVRADRLDDGRFALVVRDGRTVSLRRNGLPTTGAEEGYSVPALFEMLERELELAGEPQRGFGAPPGYRAYLRVRFDPATGLPARYRRVVGGTSNGVEIEVERFLPRD